MMQPPASLWWSTLIEAAAPGAPLTGDQNVDVAIVGGGFTGLWTARELLRRDPLLSIAIIEKSVCGFGASGRNGGWASGLFPVSNNVVRRTYGDELFHHQRHVLNAAVAALGAAAAADGIDCDFSHGGTLQVARSPLQAARIGEEVEAARRDGIASEDFRWLTPHETRERVSMSSSHGASYSPHCARLHPAKLVRGLARTVQTLGGKIYEGTLVTRIVPGNSEHGPRVITTHGTVTARYVVRATEGFTSTLPGQRRELAPIYSLMIASSVQSSGFWKSVGLTKHETFSDGRHLLVYGQRTADNRFAFGGRGAPYHFGSTVEERFDNNQRVFDLLEQTLRELFPTLEGSRTHQWGGALAMPRDLSPSVHVDHVSGLVTAGGYTGDGVVLSFVSGHAIADLLTNPEKKTEMTRLPFVQRRSRQWEPEPLRWIGVNAGIALATRADATEQRRKRESRITPLLDRLFDQDLD